MLRPSIQPSCCSPCRKAVLRSCVSGSSAAWFISTPMRRIRSPCCARAANGHAAAPPSSVMKSRRFILYIVHILLSTIRAYEMMTPDQDVAIRPRMGRKMRWPERVMAKLAAGTLERIAAVLDEGEERTAFFREAIEREIARRQARGKRAPRRGHR